MARRKEQANREALGMVPPEFAEMFAGVPDELLRERLLGWMDRRFGSSRAYLFWLVELAAGADRETVRLDAVRFLVTMLHGDAPQEVIVTARREVEKHGNPAELTPPARTAALLHILGSVGQLAAASRAVQAGNVVDTTVEQVPGADPRTA